MVPNNRRVTPSTRSTDILSNAVALSLSAVILVAGCNGKGESDTAAKSSLETKSNNATPIESQSTPQDTNRSHTNTNERRVNLFEEAPTKGFEWKYDNGQDAGVSSIVESLGGGGGIIDFDGDGKLDVCLPGGGKFALPSTISGLPTGLLQNLGDWQFRQVADKCRVSEPRCYTHGVAVADYDNDGFSDLLITGYGALQLFHNQGDGTFIETAVGSGLTDQRWSTSAAWADLNLDGCLDLYVCHYVNWSFDNHLSTPGPTPDQREVGFPQDFEGLKDSLYLSNCDSTFSDASDSWNLVEGGKGLGVVVGDLNADGRPDVYVANDTTDNFLYLNEGDKLVECGISSGVARDDNGVPQGSMGVDICDFNNDAKPDLWVANYERESFALYRNEGRGLFLYVSRPTGITALGGLFVGFGTKFIDADGDGDPDVLVANGHVVKYPKFSKRKQRPLLLLKDGARFVVGKHADDNYLEQLHEGRGIALGDLNNDGYVDVVICNVNEPVACLKSTLTSAQSKPLTVHLVGTQSNRDAIGSTANVKCKEGTISGMIVGGGSYLSACDMRLVMQIPANWQPEFLEITWPTGKKQQLPWEQIQSSVLTVVEGLALD